VDPSVCYHAPPFNRKRFIGRVTRHPSKSWLVGVFTVLPLYELPTIRPEGAKSGSFTRGGQASSLRAAGTGMGTRKLLART
jgi:hypothetical protein